MKYFKIGSEGELPVRGSHEAAGCDLFASEDVTIFTGQHRIISTGVGCELPSGTVGIIKPRSKLAAKFGIDVLAGVVDADYRGEIKVVLINHGKQAIELKKGDKIAQLLTVPVDMSTPHWGIAAETARGSAGIDDKDTDLRM